MSKNRRGASSFVGVQLHTNRTPTGRASTVAVRRAAGYIAYGRQQGAEAQQRGQWLGADGQVYSHEAVLDWAKERVRERCYTVHVVLSVGQAQLSGDDYRRALAVDETISGEYRLMVHRDSRYSHAHALLFWDKRLEKKRFLQWQAEVQATLSERETAQLMSEQMMSQELALDQTAPTTTEKRARRLDWGLEI
jgi:hypothetical protein